MERFVKISLTALVFCILFIPSLLFALDDFYDAAGFNPNREIFSMMPYEHMDTFTGGLILSNIDARLPGNGGLDLVIQRTYNSKIWKNVNTANVRMVDNSWMGLGWTLHFGRVIDPYGANPIIEMPDGSQHKTYMYVTDTTKKITRDYWIYDPNISPRTVTFTDGRKIYFGHAGPQIDGKPTLYATKITDTNGNVIDIVYVTPNGNDEIIDYVKDSVGRYVYFYTSTVNSAKKLARISGTGVDVEYTHTSISNVYYSLLMSATPAVGDGWDYTYNTSTSPKYEMTSFTSPAGGTVSYQHVTKDFVINSQHRYFRVVNTRQTSGRDIPSGTWNFSYASGTSNDTTTITDPCGRTITYKHYGYGYNNAFTGTVWKIGLPLSKSIPGEETINYVWDKSGAISYEEDPSQFNTDSDIWVPLLVSKSITRDGDTYATTYPIGNYDSYGNPKTISESGDKTRTTTRTYWYNTTKNIVQNKPATETVSGGFSGTFATNYTYNSTSGNLTQLSKYGVTTNYAYNTNGNISSMTDANSNATSYLWSNGVISKITNPEYYISRVINTNGTIASETDGRGTGYTTSFTYDGNLRLTSIDPPVGNTTTFTYPSDNSYKKETRGSFVTYYYYDGFGRPTGTSNSKGVTTDIFYQACGLKDYSTSNIGDTVYYDNFGRIEQVVHKDSNDINYSYSGSNVTMTDELNKATTYTYNAFGNPDEKFLVSVTDPLPGTTTYGRNILGSLTSTTQGSITRSFTFNTKNFLTFESHPETGTINYTRDNVGNMTQKSDAFGTKYYTYDDINRLTNIDYGADSVAFTYDKADNRTSMTSPSADIDYTYDKVNRLTQKTESIAGRSYTTQYGYDLNDNLTDIYYPSGKHVTYGYNSYNEATSVGGFGGSVSSVAYNLASLPTYYSFSNGKSTSLTYNSRFFTTGITSSGVVDVDYTYDTRGNTTAITNYLDRPKDQSFTYDNLSRLTGYNGAWGTGSYTYNSTGNRLTKKIGTLTTNYSYSSNRLSSTTGGEPASYGYNNYGSLTSMTCAGGNFTLTYDNLNNMKTYKLGANTLASFAYDGDGMRVTKTTWKTIVYHYDKDGRTLSETDNNGNLIADYIYLNGKLVAKAEPSNLYFYHTDPAGTALAMTNTSGTVVWETDYKPFGEEQSITGTKENNVKFAGKEKDKETGLYYFGARYLGPKTGRFVTVDPVGIREKDLLNPQRLNRYSYSLNNPYKFIDPDGRVVWDLVDFGFFAHSAYKFTKDPSWSNAGDLALNTAGLLPVIPSLGMIKRVGEGVDRAMDASKAAKIGMMGEKGTKFTSKTVWERGRTGIHVENPNPGQRPGQIHYQEGNNKYLYDPNEKVFRNAPNRVNELLKKPDVQKSINKAMKYLGE